MKIAIVGAGLSGLSCAWHLLQMHSCYVTLFDPQGVGGGASGVAAGLMHPYPGEEGKRSFMASEALAASMRLIHVAKEHSAAALINENGIMRYCKDEQMDALFHAHAKNYGDVESVPGGFLIRSGVTVFCGPYLQALWLAIQERGGVLIQKAISELEELSSFDYIILAAGAGVLHFQQASSLRVELLKGQTLKCKIPDGVSFPEQSITGNGYIAHAEDAGYCYFGSTYERGQVSAEVDVEKAKGEILPKVRHLHPQADHFEIVDAKAGFRVARKGHYYPMVGRLEGNIWICTALGSRGLLYHGLLGEILANAMLSGASIPEEFALKVVR